MYLLYLFYAVEPYNLFDKGYLTMYIDDFVR